MEGWERFKFVFLYHFRLHAKSDLHILAQMLLIKDTMSAISAGMLIYAATVEMIAGDFVFGDVDGGHGHGHGHGHLDPHQRSSDSRLDDHDDDNEPQTSDDGKHFQEQSKKGATTMKKALAVLSLFAGVAGMVIIG
jgi:solute carrier family 39 (zinc transporter), member 1/2/3